MQILGLISFGVACYFAGCMTVFVWGIKLYNKKNPPTLKLRRTSEGNKVVKFPRKKPPAKRTTKCI